MFPIAVKATHIELTPAIRKYAEEKVSMLEKVVDPEDTTTRAEVEVGRTSAHHQVGEVFRAEIMFHIGGDELRAVAKEEDLYAAIDVAKDEILRQARRRKNKRETLFRRGASAIKRMLRR